MTNKTPLEEAFEGEIWAPTEFFANHFKLWVAVFVQSGIATFVLYSWVTSDSDQMMVPVLCAVLYGIAWLFMQEARDTRPILKFSDEGLEDRRHGFTPWDKIAFYQYKKTIFSQAFGYTLVKGALPPKAVAIFRIQSMINKLSGRPARVWQKHMVVGGLEPMLYGARAKRPALDKT
ncbi:MAG: hypothetical protein ACJAVR_002675 [Paracoccaceae bacterium]|jgi:hypothetical protein